MGELADETASSADEEGDGTGLRWFSRGVVGIGTPSFLADLGHEVPDRNPGFAPKHAAWRSSDDDADPATLAARVRAGLDAGAFRLA